jgi:hypothetical protein
MKIRQKILDQINEPGTRSKIAVALKQGEQAVYVACKINADDGPLTKYAALTAISEITGLPFNKIVEEEVEAP